MRYSFLRLSRIWAFDTNLMNGLFNELNFPQNQKVFKKSSFSPWLKGLFQCQKCALSISSVDCFGSVWGPWVRFLRISWRQWKTTRIVDEKYTIFGQRVGSTTGRGSLSSLSLHDTNVRVELLLYSANLDCEKLNFRAWTRAFSSVSSPMRSTPLSFPSESGNS